MSSSLPTLRSVFAFTLALTILPYSFASFGAGSWVPNPETFWRTEEILNMATAPIQRLPAKRWDC